ncbi:MAG: hexokinase [Marinilabiliales bacterium]|nr:MAG: hexokinase [Marinilabiliales bacterium]
MSRAEQFLKTHKLRAEDVDIDTLITDFTDEMEKGLTGAEGSLRMIPTYIEADNEFLKEVPVLAIDAGGTNFRAALVKFDKSGRPEPFEIVNRGMPGLDGEISASEFFGTLADYIRPLAEQADRIGFCFSYPTEILPDRDGILLQFCKEVQAPEVVGKLVGKTLLQTLGMPEKPIVLLNDTVATLLAGKSESFGRSYSSFIGFILGTGTNTCYIESNSAIRKNRELDNTRSQIINIESGNFSRAPRTSLDVGFDNTTGNPGNYSFEKMFSGGYFGPLCLHVLKEAAGEGLFSPEASEKLAKVEKLSSEDAGLFAAGITGNSNVLAGCFTGREDAEACRAIIDTLVDRAAKLVAANLAAVVLKCGKGQSPDKPVMMTIEGTTFYKLHNLKQRFEGYFSDYLTGEKKRYVEFTEVDNSSLLGAALAGLIE